MIHPLSFPNRRSPDYYNQNLRIDKSYLRILKLSARKGKNLWMKLKNLLQNRNFILISALGIGLLWGKGAQWTEPLTLPALAIVMTLSSISIPGSIFRSFRGLLRPSIIGIVMNYFILGTALLVLNAILIYDEALRLGFILIAAVPPAVAVIPFTYFLKGDETLSLIGTVGAYLGALIIIPLSAFLLLGSGFIDPIKLVIIMLELILLPLIASRLLLKIEMAPRLDSIRGAITNWSFFILTYTIVGLNRDLILNQPLSLSPVILIALLSTFLLGWGIEKVGTLLHLPPKVLTSFVLLGTLKNYGLAGGLALALFSKKTSVPATVSAVFMIVYIIWLEFRVRRKH
jgi:bile acid:Na+ symporter, BASS family